tara:strand:+ start:321 stop:551 length:231 start_codon:yes stop_codon:yes gene_type:complete
MKLLIFPSNLTSNQNDVYPFLLSPFIKLGFFEKIIPALSLDKSQNLKKLASRSSYGKSNGLFGLTQFEIVYLEEVS